MKEPTIIALTNAKKGVFFPLDKQLALRSDQWSGGVARIATRCGLLGKSFERASETVSDVLGCGISRESVRLITQQWGECADTSRNQEVERVFNPTEPEEPPIVAGITTQASISTDGGMVHVRGEGYKEVKMTVVSQVRPKKETELTTPKDSRRYAPYEKQVMLEAHSYQVGLWDAETAGQHQYAEALRRGLQHCPKKSAVADAARWIQRVTQQNFPDMEQIVDWFHAAEKMWTIGDHFFPDCAAKTSWVEAQLDALWQGDTAVVLATLDALPSTKNQAISSAIGYFDNQKARMAYPRYRISGYPIGSGCVESGINTVVHHRLKTQGRGWKRGNVNKMLAALSLFHSGQFRVAWDTLPLAA